MFDLYQQFLSPANFGTSTILILEFRIQQEIRIRVTKKEPKSDDRLSKFDWHDLSQFFFVTIMFLIDLRPNISDQDSNRK